jgi:hypothetical protein
VPSLEQQLLAGAGLGWIKLIDFLSGQPAHWDGAGIQLKIFSGNHEDYKGR